MADFVPAPPPDQFLGAEANVNQERLDALNSLALYGRTGIENVAQLAKVTKAEVPTESAHNADLMRQLGGSADAVAELQKQFAPQQFGDYGGLIGRTGELLSQQAANRSDVQSNYFKQIQESIPLYRQQAADITSQYKAAYEERQAQVAQQAELERQRQAQQQATIDSINAAAAAQAQAAAEQLAQIRQLAAASASGGGGGGTSWTAPVPVDMGPSQDDIVKWASNLDPSSRDYAELYVQYPEWLPSPEQARRMRDSKGVSLGGGRKVM